MIDLTIIIEGLNCSNLCLEAEIDFVGPWLTQLVTADRNWLYLLKCGEVEMETLK